MSKVKTNFDENGLKLNVNKTEIIQFQNIRNKNERLKLILHENDNITLNCKTKFVGLIIDENLRWVDHVDYICKKLSSIIFAINELKHESEIECLITTGMYFANFHCHIKYGILCWGNSIDAKRVFKL
jgi:hypothetical protein